MTKHQDIANEIIADFKAQLEAVKTDNAALVTELAGEIEAAGAHDDLSDYVADRVADLKDELAAKAANRFEKPDDQEEAMGLVEAWVADNVYNLGGVRTDIALAIYAMGAEEAAVDIRAEIGQSNTPK